MPAATPTASSASPALQLNFLQNNLGAEVSANIKTEFTRSFIAEGCNGHDCYHAGVKNCSRVYDGKKFIGMKVGSESDRLKVLAQHAKDKKYHKHISKVTGILVEGVSGAHCRDLRIKNYFSIYRVGKIEHNIVIGVEVFSEHDAQRLREHLAEKVRANEAIGVFAKTSILPPVEQSTRNKSLIQAIFKSEAAKRCRHFIKYYHSDFLSIANLAPYACPFTDEKDVMRWASRLLQNTLRDFGYVHSGVGGRCRWVQPETTLINDENDMDFLEHTPHVHCLRSAN